MTYVPKQSERIGEGEESRFQPRERVGSHLFIPPVIFDLMHEGSAPTPDVTTEDDNHLRTVFEPSGAVLEEMSLKQIKDTLSDVRELRSTVAALLENIGNVQRKLEDPLGLQPDVVMRDEKASKAFESMFGSPMERAPFSGLLHRAALS